MWGGGEIWPSHEIAITNSAWCMAYKGGVGGGRILRNSNAIVLRRVDPSCPESPSCVLGKHGSWKAWAWMLCSVYAM